MEPRLKTVHNARACAVCSAMAWHTSRYIRGTRCSRYMHIFAVE